MGPTGSPQVHRSRVIDRRMGNSHLGYVFPGFTDDSALEVFNGVDIPPESTAGGDGLSADGFEI